jgi:hypothetical protein
MGNAIGALRTAAAKLGLSVEEYQAHVDNGEKWCTRCKDWHPRGSFQRDRTRGDGLNSRCVISRRGEPHRPPAAAQEAAHRALRLAVRYGRIPRASTLPCVDCGHVWTPGERRHEYDHHLGYAPEHRLDVQPVCTTCHADRERARRRVAECELDGEAVSA